MKTSLIRNLQIGFGLSLLLFIVISIASYTSIKNLFKSNDLVSHSNVVIGKLEYIASVMKDAETGQRGYLLTGDDSFLEPYNGSYQKAIASAADFELLTADNPTQQKAGKIIKETLVKRLKILQVLIDKKKAGGLITISDLTAGKTAMDALRKNISIAKAEENRLLHKRLPALSRYTIQAPLLLIVAAFLAIAISAVSYFRVIRDIKARLKMHHELGLKQIETTRVNAELAVVNEELAATNEELASANEEMYASNEELSSTNTQLVEAREVVQELNEKLAASNEELFTTIEELYQSQTKLKNLNDELEERIGARTKDLSASENRFRTMMETLPQIAWTNTNEGEITFLNKQWLNYTGLSFEQSLARKWGSVVHPDDLPPILKKYKSILAGNEEGEFEARERRADGVYRWHLICVHPVKNELGEVQLWVGTATDIHELKTLQQQKDDFISIASHELKTPITSLKVSLQFLNRVKHSAPTQLLHDLVRQANKSLDRVSALIETLLNVSKLNQGQLHLNKTRFKLVNAIDDCCQHVRIENIYSIVTTGNLELQVNADRERIEQVVINFVNNAIKYAADSKEIAVTIEQEDKMAKVSVTDKGPGIQPEKIPHLFERYYQVDNAGMQYSGLGLGLYISSEIVKKHNGQIGVNSEMGTGSTFWFTIPIG